MVFQDSTNLNSISKYIVDANGDTPYTTIQSAIDAANTAGGNATVYIRHGTFVEDLTLRDTVFLEGQTESGTIIDGTHTPPATGTINIRKVTFQDATAIFSSAVAGTTTLLIEDSAFIVTNGYTFDLANWTGDLIVFDIGSIGTNDGVVNNTGGATLFFVGATLGNGVGNSMIASGTTVFENVSIQCPISFQGTGTTNIRMGSNLSQTITTAATNTVTITNTTLSTGANAAIAHASTSVMELADVTIDSSNATPIGGTGTINFGSVTFLDDNTIAGTITETLTSIVKTGEIHAENIQDQTFTGFLEFTGVGSIYTVVGTTFTLDRPGTGYIKGKKVSWLGAQSTAALAAGDTYFISIDEDGVIQTANARTNALYEDEIVLFEMLVDASSNTIVVRDNHPYAFPVESSNWAHDVVGTVIANKNGGANITLNGTKAIEIDTADELEDHGLETDIPDSGGVAETFNFMFTDAGGDWDTDSAANTFPSEYNNGGVVAALGANKYGVFRLFVSKDDIETVTPTYYAIFDTSQYNNLGQAQTAIANNSIANISNELADLEMAQLGFVIKEESSDNIVDVIIEKSVAGTQTSMPSTNLASLVTTSTTNFDGWLSAADTTVQLALDTLDEVGKGPTIDPVAATDSFLQFDEATVGKWRIGNDATDDSYRISQGSALGTNDTFIMTSAGERTMPLQPAFSFRNSATDANQTGDGAVATIDFDTEIFDQGGDFAADTFTAPITGRYFLQTGIVLDNIIGASGGTIRIVTSNRTYQSESVNWAVADVGSKSGRRISCLADMDAADTATAAAAISGQGANTVGIFGNGDMNTFFTGNLQV